MPLIFQDPNSTQVVKIKIPKKYKKIAVNCSGGADSSILLYILVKYIKDKNIDAKISVITCSTDVKDRWTGRKAEAVINFIIENVGSGIIDMHYNYFRDRPKTEYFHDVESTLLADKRADVIVSGITSNPPPDTFVKNIDGSLINLSDNAVSARDGNQHEIRYLSPYNTGDFWSPFANVDKRFVAFLYDKYAVRDTLFPLTRSCENKTPLEQTFDPQFEETVCGTCWWCLERKWAFGKF